MSGVATTVLYSGNLGIDYGQFYMDVAYDEDEALDEDGDFLAPADPTGDEVVKQTLESAAYWHREWGSMD